MDARNGARLEEEKLGGLAVTRFREDLFWKEIFVSGIPKINQNQLPPEIFDGTHESAFPWQKTSGFLRSNRLDCF
jgi:hypothetical protein